MREYIEYVRICINSNADLEELESHLGMNGYDFGIDKKRRLLFVYIEEVEYVETILEDREISFEVSEYC